MNVEELFHRLLGLGESWEVIGCEYQEKAGSFFVVIKETMWLWEKERCPKCGQAVRCYDHVETMSHSALISWPKGWRHLNVFNKQSEILCELPRGRCPHSRQRHAAIRRESRSAC